VTTCALHVLYMCHLARLARLVSWPAGSAQGHVTLWDFGCSHLFRREWVTAEQVRQARQLVHAGKAQELRARQDSPER